LFGGWQNKIQLINLIRELDVIEKAKAIIGKYQILIFIIISIILIAVSWFIGSETATTKIEHEKVTYDEIIQKINDKEEELEGINSDIEVAQSNYESVSGDLTEVSDEFKEVQSIIAEKETIVDEKEKVQAALDELKKKDENLKKSISDKESELSSITGKIKEAKGQPKILSAGKFIVGKDLPAGRYKAVPNGGFGNFIVNQGMDVNIILGSGDFGESEYVFEAFDGDEIELTTSAKFIPIE